MANHGSKHTRDLLEGPFLFVVNPNSGTGASELFLKIIDTIDKPRKFDVVKSQSKEHSIELAASAKDEGYSAVIAVGGDGSVHEIGTALIGSSTALGIIPTGSGNGVSRHLQISNHVEKAIEQVLEGNTRMIDTLKVNGRNTIGFCGVGIDAYVARLFDNADQRGFSNYVKLTIDAFMQYKPTSFQINHSGIDEELIAYSVIAANTTQLGNNAYINPKGIDDDGLMELIVIEDFPPAALMPLASRLFLKNLDKSKHVRVFKGENFELKNPGRAPVQIDGEPLDFIENITFEVNPKSLRVIIP